MAAKDGVGERRRTRSPDERKRIVEEALAPGVSVAAVARRHGLNANLIFKWIRRSREGWRDRRREPAKEKPVRGRAAGGGRKSDADPLRVARLPRCDDGKDQRQEQSRRSFPLRRIALDGADALRRQRAPRND